MASTHRAASCSKRIPAPTPASVSPRTRGIMSPGSSTRTSWRGWAARSTPGRPNGPRPLIDALPGDRNPDGFVFPGYAQRQDTLRLRWRTVCTDAGLGKLRLHDLRHTAASHAVMSGENLPLVGPTARTSAASHHRGLRSSRRRASCRGGGKSRKHHCESNGSSMN